MATTTARHAPSDVASTWVGQPWSIRLLRAFLGVTFLYAGVQKLLDAGFLHQGSPTYIGTQLEGFAQGTPAAGLMHVLARWPLATGLGVALVETAIGVATLLGVAPIAAAFAGAAINLTLLLSATWHVHPYFLGSDSIYAVAWVALALAIREREPATAPARRPVAAVLDGGIGRRQVLRGGVVGALSVVAVGLAAAFATPVPTAWQRSVRDTAGGPPSSRPSSGPSPSTAPSHELQPRGTTIGNVSDLPVGSAVGFTAPGIGPAALVRLADDRIVAYSRICTHAGCEVGYDPSARLLVCPCHGAEFDPANGAEPVAGPTSTPLQMIDVVLDQHTGDIILPG
jgi:thiosulfate dehydrogenase (quinone) large subunit